MYVYLHLRSVYIQLDCFETVDKTWGKVNTFTLRRTHNATKGTYVSRADDFAAAYRKRENLIVLKENTLASEWRHNLISRLTDRIYCVFVWMYVLLRSYSLFSLRRFNLIFCCFGILVHRATLALLLPFLGCPPNSLTAYSVLKENILRLENKFKLIMIYDYFLFGVGVPTYLMGALKQSLFLVCFYIFIYVPCS